ncbi:MAG: LOG family protein, partial [Planctomycetes bacterium]|nr:LOG family protein [Planctomycetota bacterium]
LVQNGKTKKYMPIIVYGREYWDELIDFEAMIRWNTIAADDMKLFHFIDDVDSAFKLLKDKLSHIYLRNTKGKK